MNWSNVFIYLNGELWWKNRGRGRQMDKPAGGYKDRGYKEVRYQGKLIGIHRIIWELHNGLIPKNFEIDHINGITDDNRIENLRIVTKSQNQMNSKIHANNSTGIKNVFYNKRLDKWQVKFSINGKNVYNKRYETLEEASKIAKLIRLKLHKEFSRDN